ncbi:MAG: GNAT family N-acetyltransferase [Propionibacteriaceae bacterium]|nr:GNAT family N-acetyltransferase [Propionibacteriaceae bacterium]
MAEVQVTKNEGETRWEAHLDGELAGFAQYQLANDVIVFTHTEVDPKFEGKGVGGALARTALDDVRADGSRKVIIVCPFITGWIARHPEYADLIYGAAKG